jgi:hypothetical protein
VTVAAGIAGAPPVAAAPPTTYENPVSRSFADTFADPAILKAKDGAWYSYATTDPLREGERTFHTIPMARSTDMVNWTYAGDAFSAENRPTWAEPSAGIWAPDVRYIDGRYVMYFGVTDTTLFEGANDSAIGVATSPTPVGPWTDSGAPVVGPRPGASGNPGDFLWTFDSTGFTDVDGSHYLYFGSYYGGHLGHEAHLGRPARGRADAADRDRQPLRGRLRRAPRRLGLLLRLLGELLRRPDHGLQRLRRRSRSPLEPPVDRDGISLNESRVGGTVVITPNGNRWIGPGPQRDRHRTCPGQDWFVYHAIDRADPYLDEPFGINERPMLIDRLDWIDGWPTVRGGRWASEGPQTGPVTTPDAGADFNAEGATLEGWRNVRAWQIVRTEDEGFVRQRANSCTRPRFLLTVPPRRRTCAPRPTCGSRSRRPAGSSSAIRTSARTRSRRSTGRRRALVVEALRPRAARPPPGRGAGRRLPARGLAQHRRGGARHDAHRRGDRRQAQRSLRGRDDPAAGGARRGRAAGVASTCGRVDADNIA